MNVNAVSGSPKALAVADKSSGIYPFMGVLFIVVAMLGFGPNSVGIVTGRIAVPPPIVHVHAALMASWLVLFLLQGSLMARGHARIHKKLGLVSFALAPAMIVAMTVLTVAGFLRVVAAADNPAFGLSSQFVGRASVFALFVQGRAVILFGVFCVWAILARRNATETHKRAMLMATFVLIDASLTRMNWLPGHPHGPFSATDAGYDAMHAYHLLLMTPALIYDVAKRKAIHHAYVIGLGLYLSFVAITHYLWGSASWHAAVNSMVRGTVASSGGWTGF